MVFDPSGRRLGQGAWVSSCWYSLCGALRAKPDAPASFSKQHQFINATGAFRTALRSPKLICRSDMHFVVLQHLRAHVISLLCSAWRRPGTAFGSSNIESQVKDVAAVSHEGAQQPGLTSSVPSQLVSLLIPLKGSSSREGALALAMRLQGYQHANSIGPIGIADENLVSWADIVQHLSLSSGIEAMSLPEHVDYVGINAGDFARHVYFSCLRLSSLMK